jgi:hypothetical protein
MPGPGTGPWPGGWETLLYSIYIYLKKPTTTTTTTCSGCTTALFYKLAPTCFSSSLPSSESFLDPSELLELQMGWVVYHIMCGYVTCVPECCGSVCCASQRSKELHRKLFNLAGNQNASLWQFTLRAGHYTDLATHLTACAYTHTHTLTYSMEQSHS